jgi:hypothetical protein
MWGYMWGYCGNAGRSGGDASPKRSISGPLGTHYSIIDLWVEVDDSYVCVEMVRHMMAARIGVSTKQDDEISGPVVSIVSVVSIGAVLLMPGGCVVRGPSQI